MAKLKALGSRLGVPAPRLRQPPKTADPFYLSSEWRQAKAAKRREGRVWCARCGSTDRLILDHIVERRDGGADLDPINLEWLCHAHHQSKTAASRAARARRRT